MNSASLTTTQLVALDWGSSSLRAYRMGAGRVVLEQRSSDAGASRLKADAAGFEHALQTLIGDWLADVPSGSSSVPLVACGMVGSAHGWLEVPYVPCPADLSALHAAAGSVHSNAGWRLRIVPGVSQRAAGAAPDVMRGEETQLAGLLALAPQWAERACVVLPGTHSKWVDVRAGRIEAFSTCMTGELFALLCEHSVLGRLMPSQPPEAAHFDGQAFDRGVQATQRQPVVDLGRLLFSVRTLGLFGELPPSALADYLSGLLIGSELAAVLAQADAAVPLVLVGEAALCARYQRAFALWGREAAQAPGDLAAFGLWQLAMQAGWL